ncbi:hypothetical protein NCG89_03990 [Spongiibacter taiwanensis]|uniref:hypothetical protein n=1 Tax=Spongiibacter taiwanensis TaxID=1748242 RepID=UPI002035E6BD|nr:hypothetical protein [Spongiibacter taiwanensis]USA43953.1 hypothetical protein NCG89_03990 [Spongiibacter taiwanensis]
MKKGMALLLSLWLVGCANQENLVYSPGFSFADYQFIVLEKGKSSGVFGFDLQLANTFTENQFQVLGDKEVANLPYEDKKQTLGALLTVDGDDDSILLGISLQNFISGRTVATIGLAEDGKLTKKKERDRAYQQLAEALSEAIRKDRATVVTGKPRPAPTQRASAPEPYRAPAQPAPEDRPYILEPDFSE